MEKEHKTEFKTIREYLDYLNKPLERVLDGITIYTVKHKKEILGTSSWESFFNNSEYVGGEIFTLTNKDFITDPTLLKYVDKPLMLILSDSEIGLDGEGNKRRWIGSRFYVYDLE